MFGSSFALVALPALAPNQENGTSPRDLGRLVRATVGSSVVAALFVVVIAVATVALNVVRVLGAGLKASGLPAQASIGDGLGVAATVVLMVALIPPLGLLGAAVAALISYLVTLVYLARIAYRQLHISPRTLLMPTAPTSRGCGT
ncbi:MAG TPA: polysaccharide biosynthesis C-terminal domain-containing protein [Chloroflexota bacterium]|nr:polysaccharide biosynthesis C-terminal domain-containing protein [Chloroflexota bacterium]